MLEVNLCKNFNSVITEYYCSHYYTRSFTLTVRLYLFVTITSLIILSFFNQENIHYLMIYGTAGVILSENMDDSGNTSLWKWTDDEDMS